MRNLLKKFRKNENGATAIEYGLIAALIAIALIAGARSLGGELNSKFQQSSDTLKAITPAAAGGGS